MKLAALALASPPFDMSATVFWIYLYASLLLLIGLIKVIGELPREHGFGKILHLGRLFYAIPIGVFGTEHFTITPVIAGLIPRWIPAHTFWVYLVGAGFICAALSITVSVQARLAAAVVGMTFFIFVCVMDVPAAVATPHNRFFWALAARELAFSGGALALATSRSSPRIKRIPQLFIGIPALFYGVEHLLHAAYVPGIPLNKLTPEWIPGRIGLAYFVGLMLILAGLSLIVNKKGPEAATALGLTILLTVLWVYLPMLVAAPKELVALNFFFDTLLFGGAVLLLASATVRDTLLRGGTARL